MATGRILKSQISVSEQVNELSLKAALLFTWMIPHTDDFGRISGSAKKIKAVVLPMRDEFTPSDVDDALNEIHDKGLICRYKVNGEPLIEMLKFETHQQGLHKRTKSKFPSPDQADKPLDSESFPEVPGNSRLVCAHGTEQNRTGTEQNIETTNVVSCSEQNNFAHEQNEKVDDDEIKLILKNSTLYRVPHEKIDGWQELYPTVNIIAELKKLKAWLVENPKKRNTLGGMGRRITSWLARASKAAGPPPDRKFQAEIKKTFCEMLPLNPINQFSKQAEKDLQARIEEDPIRNVISFWRNFFLLVRCSGNIKQHEWHLDYLIRDQTFANILNGKRHTALEIEYYKKLKNEHSKSSEELN